MYVDTHVPILLYLPDPQQTVEGKNELLMYVKSLERKDKTG